MQISQVLISNLVLIMTIPLCDGLRCLSCNDVIKPRDCEYIQTCGDHEECFVEYYVTLGGNHRYNVGCRDIKLCGLNAADVPIYENDKFNEERLKAVKKHKSFLQDDSPALVKLVKQDVSSTNNINDSYNEDKSVDNMLSKDRSEFDKHVDTFSKFEQQNTVTHKTTNSEDINAFTDLNENLTKFEDQSKDTKDSPDAKTDTEVKSNNDNDNLKQKQIHDIGFGNDVATINNQSNLYKTYDNGSDKQEEIAEETDEGGIDISGLESEDDTRVRSGDVYICSECCQTDLCNQQGCGQAGFPTEYGPICFSCDQQVNPHDCNEIQLCGHSQVCSLYTKNIAGDVVYTTTCSTQWDCEHRNNSHCSACCTGTLCNERCSHQTTLGPTSTASTKKTTTLTKITVPPQPTCDNKVPLCDQYKKEDACTGLFRTWGLQNCPALCGTCPTIPTPTTSPPSCVDARNDCARLDNGRMCLEFAEWAKMYCKTYCGFNGCGA